MPAERGDIRRTPAVESRVASGSDFSGIILPGKQGIDGAGEPVDQGRSAGSRCAAGGRATAGLNLLGKDGAFAHFRHVDNDAHSLGGDDVWAIGEDGHGAIWVGAYAAGLDRFDESTKQFVHFRHDAANADSVASDNVLALRGDRAGNLWIGSDAGVDVRATDGRFHHVDFTSVAGGGGVNAAVFLETADGMLAGTR